MGGHCKIMRKILVHHGTMSLDGKPPKYTKKEWVTEECGTPIFGPNSNDKKVCDSCLKGWSVKENSMIDSPANIKLLAQAIKKASTADE